jgi:hypothetical protein
MNVEKIVVQQCYGKKITGICDQCGQIVSGDVGIGAVVLDGESGIIVGVCVDGSGCGLLDGAFHPITQIPLKRLIDRLDSRITSHEK